MPPKKKVPKKKGVKKTPVKRAKTASAKKTPVSKKTAKKAKQSILGIVTHYFPKVSAAVIKLKTPLKIGDTIQIKGHTTNITQTVTSMQIDRTPINTAKKGAEIGLLVNSRVRRHDKVYLNKK